jgi:hypothetical protein
MIDTRSPMMVLDNASAISTGALFDLSGSFVEHMQITYSSASNFEGSATFVVEWTHYDPTDNSGPWEEIFTATITDNSLQVSVLDPNNATPGFFKWVRARLTSATTNGTISVSMFVY